MGRRLGGIIAVAMLVATGISVARAGESATSPTVWIDQPLPGTTAPFGPLPVTIHAAAPTGLASVRLLVDGQAAARLDPPGGDLVTVTWTWQPTNPGTHLLTVIAATADGSSSAPVSAGVTFVGASTPPPASPAPSASPSTRPSVLPSPSPSPRPSSTPRPSPSPRASPAPTACLPTAPDLFGPADGSKSYASSGGDKPVFWWGYHIRPACPATSFHLKLSTNSDLSSPLYQPIVLASSGSGYSWTWIPPSPLPYARACTTYYWTVIALEASGTPGGAAPTWSVDVCP